MDRFLDNALSFFRIINTKLVFDDGEVIDNAIISINRSFSSQMFSTSMSYVKASVRGVKDFKNRSFSFEVSIATTMDDYSYTLLEPYVNSSGGYTIPGAYLSVENGNLKFNDDHHTFMIDNGNGLSPYEVMGNGAPVSIRYQTYYIDNDSIEIDMESDQVTFTAYDSMSKFAKQYEPLDIEYPCTVLAFTRAVCDRVGVVFNQSTLVNGEQTIDGELYSNQSFTYRDVIKEIAGVSGGIAFIDFDDHLVIRGPTETNVRIEQSHISNAQGINHNEKFGPVNSVVLSLMPQEDNYYKKDDLSIQNNGLCEVKLSNNQIVQSKRESFIDSLFDALYGIEYYPFEADSFGYGIFRPNDIVTLVDLEGSEKQSIVFNSDITLDGSFSEKISAEIPESYVTDYSKATNDVKLLYRTQLEVDKQKGQIDSLVAVNDENKTNLTNVIQTATSLTIKIGTVEDTIDSKLNEEEVQSLIDQGINNIKGIRTLTGVFDDEGLTFDRSTNQLQSNYSENGMRIMDGSDIVQVTDKTGTDSKNVRVREYLIIGKNSRFEDYLDGTGCFFIGGDS